MTDRKAKRIALLAAFRCHRMGDLRLREDHMVRTLMRDGWKIREFVESPQEFYITFLKKAEGLDVLHWHKVIKVPKYGHA